MRKNKIYSFPFPDFQIFLIFVRINSIPMKSLAYITGICLLLMTATACNKDGKVGTDNDINIFSIQDDIEMGQNVAAQIAQRG